MEKRFRFRHVNELTGLLVLAVIGIVVAGLFFSGNSQRWFARKFSFDVALPEEGAGGLRRGDGVFVLGVAAGMVDDLRVGDDGSMTAHVKIRGDFERFVRVDSVASIKKTFGLAGDSFLEVSRGHGAPLPSRGAFIPCLAPEDALDRTEKMLANLRNALMPAVQNAGATFETWNRLGVDLRKTQGELSQLVVRLDGIATQVEEGKGTAGKLITDTSLADEARKVLDRANAVMGQLHGAATNLDVVLKNLENGTARLPEITGVMADEAKDLPGLVQQTHVSMRELERLIEAVQRHWLLRKYVDQDDPPSLRPRREPEEPDPSPVKPSRSSKGAIRR